jgi:hypothetical protein
VTRFERVRKPKGPTARARAKKARASRTAEDKHKATVREKDVYCRFPLCGCRTRYILPHVSHQRHKGMGGNPKGDRSVPSLMIMLCATRHREGQVAVDQGTLRWRAMDRAGARGPVAWDVNASVLDALGLGYPYQLRDDDGWVEVACEIDLHVFVRFHHWQRAILDRLAEMDI